MDTLSLNCRAEGYSSRPESLRMPARGDSRSERAKRARSRLPACEGARGANGKENLAKRLLLIDIMRRWRPYANYMHTDGYIFEAREKLGARIVELRKAQNLSQRKFALMIGINRTYLIDVEHGRRNVAFDNLMKIANGLGVSISELVANIEYKG